MRLSRMSTAVLVAMASTLWATASRAEIVFCNQFARRIYVAIAYQQTNGSFVSRGWMSLEPGACSPFDTALRVKTFFYRAQSEKYRDAGRTERYIWGKGWQFAIWENDNFQYYHAEQRVFNSTLKEFSKSLETDGEELSEKLTFREGGTDEEIPRVEHRSTR